MRPVVVGEGLGAGAGADAGRALERARAVTRLRFVRSAQALGLSLAEIADVLRIRDTQSPPCAHVTELLHTHLRTLQARITELTALHHELRGRRPPGRRP